VLFEKSSKNKKKRFEYVFDFFAYGYIALIFIILFSLALTLITSITGDKIKGVDVLNSLAQIATALAFVFAVYQYRKNSDKERQNVIAAEAKLLTTRMSAVADKAKENTKYTIEDINNFISLMSNLGTDFMALYEALTDDVHKAMVRMRWQDMHYNHLSKTLHHFTIDRLFENESLEKDFRGYSFYNARFDSSIKSKLEIFQEYFFSLKVLNEMSIGGEIVKKFESFFLFEAYFFDDKTKNDLMHGLLSRLDFKTTAPLLAAIKEKQRV
tara:strand:- start:1077 stop:1883 length:807 start_codon:yes stop_codon:yes gene_type:complete